MDFDVYQVAAFTNASFGGNPAAVIPLREWIDDELMQMIAAENNLSETAFFVPVADSEWEIRWFTPTVEVPLCGHATLASAAVIRDKLAQSDWPITLHSKSGPLLVDQDGERFVLDLPSNPPQAVTLPAGLAEAMGVTPAESYIGKDIYLLILEDERAVAQLAPDFSRVSALTEHGVIVSAPGDNVDFVSRFFAPAIGIDEDPVTGAAHCLMTPYWSSRLQKNVLSAAQISARVGQLVCEQRGERVRLTGSAVFFLSGRISL